MTPYMIDKLAPNSIRSTKELVEYVPAGVVSWGLLLNSGSILAQQNNEEKCVLFNLIFVETTFVFPSVSNEALTKGFSSFKF